MSAKRSENAPFTSDRMAPGGEHRTAISMKPVADDVLTYTGRVVRKIGFSDSTMRANIASNSAPRCGNIGASMVSSTSRRTSVGPGRKNVPNGTAAFGLITCAFMVHP